MRFLPLAALMLAGATATAADPWLSFPGGDGPGKGKKIVLVSGDEEYRSEEVNCTQLGQDPRQAARLRLHRPLRHRPEGRHHQRPT